MNGANATGVEVSTKAGTINFFFFKGASKRKRPIIFKSDERNMHLLIANNYIFITGDTSLLMRLPKRVI